MSVETRGRDSIRRGRLGLAIGAALAFSFGGWPGLFAALLVVAVARALKVR